ncbi:hypothetical protein F2P56_020638 [Juglans regia]|uniref:Myeloid leukemia factor 1-like n=2 Tax=Juglans regia TaxID=51240 RepID=A0A833XAI6_JUGRE|nr:uncharacterized protein LOC108984797 [Juglans regia]XP_018812401.1 uncharacterized protein LOC108984797 [Juglans regia]XP_018812402.1 uncharacterized protein LOC108984797 [Juglans regia]KAF5460793.1 hypothetical protein F2P56_020635 [Juglans regia]KAF5460794.1 hypothetical protein F2P56_020636 [Juglans regia]KAF5460795.1 hypothetical protein F2P56_020637 [Juglans regia]KAF5460796.1 hypothetical protein F2P56_020638 [Juglans regia]
MQGGQGGRDPFGDPFANFGGFGGFGAHRSLLSGFLGGRDPFNDPFFTRPFGGMFDSSFFGSGGHPFMNMHPSGLVDDPIGRPFMNMYPPGFLENQAPEPERPRGPIIEELNSEDEKEDTDKEKRENPRKHGRSSSAHYVEDPDDEVEEKKSKQLQYRNEYKLNDIMPQSHTSFTFGSSSVNYGGPNGAYYTASKTRRMGSDGLSFEEIKEANTVTGQAKHRVSRGFQNKGHSVTRKLNSEGKVDTMQTLHNLNEDELTGFEEAWKGNARKKMPGLPENYISREHMGAGGSGQNGQASTGGWALPSIEPAQPSVIPDGRNRAGYSGPERSGWKKSDVGDGSSYSRGKGRN